MIPFDNREGFIWFNGKTVPWEECKIHVLSHGLHYGSCVFEGLRVYDGHVFKLELHVDRLIHSAHVLGFDIPYTKKEINSAILEIVSIQKIKDGYVRPVAWRGSEMMAISAQKTSIHLAIATWPWPSYFSPELKLKGIRLKISDWSRPAPNTAPIDSKAAGLYMICTLSKHNAEKEGFDDALMLDYRGQIAEATGANFFMVKKGELYTPLPDCFLNGITRQTVIELAKKNNIEVHETTIKPDDLLEAEEAFITGTAVEITPVREIDDYKFKIGTTTVRLIDLYDKLIEKEKSQA